MVDLRIHVIRPSGKNDAPGVVLTHICQGAQALLAHIVFEDGILTVCGLHRQTGLILAHTGPGEDIHDPFDQLLPI